MEPYREGREPWHDEMDSLQRMERTDKWLLRGLGAIVAIIAFGLFLSTARAQPGPPCKPERELRKELFEGYKEIPVGYGLAGGGQQAIVIYASPEGDTFTIAVVRSDGQACMIAAGHGLDIGDFPEAGEES